MKIFFFFFCCNLCGRNCSEAMKTLTFNTIELPKLIHKKNIPSQCQYIVTYSPHISPQFILPATIPKEIGIIYPPPSYCEMILSQFINYNLDLFIVEYVRISFLENKFWSLSLRVYYNRLQQDSFIWNSAEKRK